MFVNYELLNYTDISHIRLYERNKTDDVQEFNGSYVKFSTN